MSPGSNYKRSPGKRIQYSPETHRGMVDALADQMFEDFIDPDRQNTYDPSFYQSLDLALPPMVVNDATFQFFARMRHAQRSPRKFKRSPKKYPITPPERRKQLQMIDDLSKEMATELINKNRSDLSKYTDRGVPHEIARLAKQKAYDLEKQIRENPPKKPIGHHRDHNMNLNFIKFRREQGFAGRPLIQPRPELGERRMWVGKPYDASKRGEDGWMQYTAPVHGWWSPGKHRTFMEVPRKRVRPAFYDDIDVMNEMIDDELTGEFDPDKTQEQQTKAYYQTVPTRMYDEALEKFKVISDKFDDVPEKTLDNPRRSPTFDERITEDVQFAKKVKRYHEQDFMGRRKQMQDRFMRQLMLDDVQPAEEEDDSEDATEDATGDATGDDVDEDGSEDQ